MILTQPICSVLKELNKKEAEEILSSASFPNFFSCFINCESKDTKICKYRKYKITQYLAYIINNRPWLIPAGKLGISYLSTLPDRELNPDLKKRIDKETKNRSEFLSTNKVRKNLKMPNPGVLIITNEKNTCYLSGFVEATDYDRANLNAESSLNYLQKAEELFSKKAEIPPVYDIAINNRKNKFYTPVNGNSAMLSYYIKRWFEEKGLEPDGKIAATGGIITEDSNGKIGNITAVEGIEIKLKSALEFGYQYVFYPECQSDVVRNKLGTIVENTTKLIPISNIEELEQRLLFLSEYRLALSNLQQYIEGTRNDLSNEAQKRYMKSYFKGIIRLDKRSNLFKQLQLLFTSCESIIPSRKREIQSIFFKLIEDGSFEKTLSTNQNLLRYKTYFIKAMLPKPIWHGLLPFIIKDLHDTKENTGLKQELYLRNLEKFYNHDICATIASRLSFKLRALTKFWEKNRSFANEFKHIWGICSFEPLSLASELSNIKGRNNFEEDLFCKTLQNLIKTNESNEFAIPYIGMNPYAHVAAQAIPQYPGLSVANDYFAGLRETIASIFPGFEPKKFRYLRWDQRLGCICRILYNLSQEKHEKPHYAKYSEKLINILEKTFNIGLFDCYKNDNDRPALIKFRTALLSLSQYENKDKIKELYQLSKENLKSFKKDAIEDSLIRYIKALAELYDDPEKGETSIIDKSKLYIKNGSLIEGYYNELKKSIANFGSFIQETPLICINPAYGLANLFISPNPNQLKYWLSNLNHFCADFENIFNITGIAIALAFFAGQHYQDEIPSELSENKYGNIFLLGHFFTTKNSEQQTLINPHNLGDKVDMNALFLLQGKLEQSQQDPNIISILSNINMPAYYSDKSSIPEVLLKIPGNKYEERNWKSEIENYLLQTTRTKRKSFYLDILYNHPEIFLRLPFAELDPEYYSLTLLYLIAKNKYYNVEDNNLFKKLEKKIFFFSKNLLDLETIKTLKLLNMFINKDSSSIKHYLTGSKLGFMNLKIALTMLSKLKVSKSSLNNKK